MGLLVFPEYLRKQPVSLPLMNRSSLIGRQQWAMVHIPVVGLGGNATPVCTPKTSASYGSSIAGYAMLQNSITSDSGFSYGNNAGLQLDVSSGVCVFTANDTNLPLFNTSSQADGGFILFKSGNNVKLAKKNVDDIITSSNAVVAGKPNVVAWSYNKNTGRALIALNGYLTTATKTETFAHGEVRALAYQINTGGAGTGSISLLAVSTDECFGNQALLETSINPWSIFTYPKSNLIWIGAGAGGGAALAGSAAAQASASGELTTQVSLVGAATTVATASGALTTQVPLAGQAAAVSLASGTLSITVALTGSALANALATGALSTSIALSGSALANVLATGNLLASGSGALSGTAAAQASASGALSTAIPLQGAASALAIAAGGLTTAVPLAGVAVAVSHVTGDLTVTFGGALSGNAVAQVLAAGALSIQVALSGSAVAHALATGILGSGDIPNTPQDTWDRALQALFEPFYGDFGESALVAGIPVVGMFSSRAQDSFGIVQPSAAVLRMSATHVAAVGDTVTVGARTYQIAAIHDLDGSGTEKTLELK